MSSPREGRSYPGSRGSARGSGSGASKYQGFKGQKRWCGGLKRSREGNNPAIISLDPRHLLGFSVK